MLPLLNGVSSVRTFLPPDVRTDKARAAVWKTVQEVQRRFNGPLPLLDPIEDLGISDERFTDLVAKAASLQSRLVANALHNAGDRDELFKLYSLKVLLPCALAGAAEFAPLTCAAIPPRRADGQASRGSAPEEGAQGD